MAKKYLIINEPGNAWELDPDVPIDEIRRRLESPRDVLDVLEVPVVMKGGKCDLKFFPSRVFAYTIVEAVPGRVGGF